MLPPLKPLHSWKVSFAVKDPFLMELIAEYMEILHLLNGCRLTLTRFLSRGSCLVGFLLAASALFFEA